jgi:MFS transporter, DHA2 family, multidrug resistance protein
MSKGGAPAAETNKWIVALAVMTGTVMAVLDSSIVNVALPNMTASFGASVEQITWVVTGYILANVIVMPILGLLTERFGRKKFYLVSVAVFTLASMACGLASTLPLMVFARVFQGIGGGVLMTLSQAIMRETFPAEEQGMAMGLFGMGIMLAPAIGPTLGGWITDEYSWPWVFYINVPIGILNFVLISRFVHDPPYLVRRKVAIDWLGLALMITGLGALQLTLEQGASNDWFNSNYILLLAIISGLGLILFVWRELTAANPAVDLRILKNVSFASATFLGGVLGMALMGSVFLLPLFLHTLLGYSAMTSGMAMLPRSLAMGLLMPVAGRFYNKLGPRVLVGSGLAVCSYGFYAMSKLTVAVGFWDLLMPQLWQGVGFSMIFVALSTAALANIDRAKITAATGLYNVVRQVFGSIGISLVAAELSRGTASNRAILAEHVTMYDATSRGWLAGVTAAMQSRGADAYTAAQQALRMLDGQMLRQAAVLAYNHIFLLSAAVFALSVPLVLLLSGSKEGEVELALE